MTEGKDGWVRPWRQPTWQRRFLTYVFWEGVLLTPLAVAYAYDTSGRWKLLAAMLPVLGLFTAIVQRYGSRREPVGQDGGGNPATVRIKPVSQGEDGAEELRLVVVRAGFIAPADAADRPAYEAFCRAMHLDQPANGWGFLCCQKDTGEHWTALTPDPANLQQLIDAGKGLQLSECKVQEFRPGWPDEWDALRPPRRPARRSGE